MATIQSFCGRLRVFNSFLNNMSTCCCGHLRIYSNNGNENETKNLFSNTFPHWVRCAGLLKQIEMFWTIVEFFEHHSYAHCCTFKHYKHYTFKNITKLKWKNTQFFPFQEISNKHPSREQWTMMRKVNKNRKRKNDIVMRMRNKMRIQKNRRSKFTKYHISLSRHLFLF